MSGQVLQGQTVEKIGRVRNLIQLAAIKMKVPTEGRDIFVTRVTPYNGPEGNDETIYLFAVQGTPFRLHGSIQKDMKANLKTGLMEYGWRVNTQKRKLFISETELTEWRFKQ